MNSKFISSIFSVTLLCLTAFVLSIFIDGWPKAFTIPDDGNIYLLIYFGLLLIFLYFFSSKLLEISTTKRIILSMFFGQIISMMSLIVSPIFYYENAFDRWTNSMSELSIFMIVGAVITVTFVRALLLGGWLFGFLSIILDKFIDGKLNAGIFNHITTKSE